MKPANLKCTMRKTWLPEILQVNPRPLRMQHWLIHPYIQKVYLIFSKDY